MRKEHDPNGLDQHAPGAKLDGDKPRPALIFDSMPRALKAVVEIATLGADKYTDDGWQFVENGVKRYTNAMDRHRLEEGGHPLDTDTGKLHAAHLAWNALARLELILRAREAAEEKTQAEVASFALIGTGHSPVHDHHDIEAMQSDEIERLSERVKELEAALAKERIK